MLSLEMNKKDLLESDELRLFSNITGCENIRKKVVQLLYLTNFKPLHLYISFIYTKLPLNQYLLICH